MTVKKFLLLTLIACVFFISANSILAQDGDPEIAQNAIDWFVLIETIIYSAIGIVLSFISYMIYDLITPFNLNKELAEDQNIAVGILIGSIFIGIALIISASIS